MTAKGHVLFALSPALFMVDTIETTERIPFLIGVILGSLLPDIDEPGSYIGRRFIFISIIIKGLGIEHRTWTHSFIFFLVFLILAIFSKSQILYGLSLGILMHQLGDMMTRGGIKGYFLPFSKETVRVLPKSIAFYTGSAEEVLFVVSTFVLAAVTKFYFFGELIPQIVE